MDHHINPPCAAPRLQRPTFYHPALGVCIRIGINYPQQRVSRFTGNQESATMAVVYVNDKPVDIGNEKLNLIQAAQQGRRVHSALLLAPGPDVVASCRMCLVEAGDKKPDGTVAMQPQGRARLPDPGQGRHRHRHQQPQGQGSPAADPRRAAAQSSARLPGVRQGRRMHAARLQLSTSASRTSRMIDDKNTPPNKPHIGEHITLFTDRCIMCSRCVRFTREICRHAPSCR